MSRVSAEMPSRAQQSCVGTASTKTCGSGLATPGGGAVRRKGADGTLARCTPSFTVAFIGESAIRAVSFRGPGSTPLRPASGLAGGEIGFGEAGGGAGGSAGDLPPVEGGGVGGLKPGGGVGGRAGGAPPAGGSGFGATNGGGRTTPDAGGGGLSPGGLAPAGGVGGRVGKLMRAVSISTGTVGVRGGRVIRTVSFFGSFRSAMTKISLHAWERRQPVSQTPPRVSTINRLRRPNHSRERQELFA